MRSRPRGTWISLLGAAVLATTCVDVEQDGQPGYLDPCQGPFQNLLRCGLETGAAPPTGLTAPPPAQRADPPMPAATCDSVCRQLIRCFPQLVDPAELPMCVAGCMAEATPALLECIARAGCDLAAVERCQP